MVAILEPAEPSQFSNGELKAEVNPEILSNLSVDRS